MAAMLNFMIASDHWRLFIALPISESVRSELESLQHEFRGKLSNRAIRWTRPDQFHLTLKFLGDVAVSNLSDLKQAVRTACSRIPPLTLTAERIECFPNDRRPRVIWVGVRDDSPRLQALQSAINLATADFGAAEFEKEFKSHLTLGRVKEMNSSQRKILSQLIRERQQLKFGGWVANEVKLIRSELSESGATHKDVVAINLNAF